MGGDFVWADESLAWESSLGHPFDSSYRLATDSNSYAQRTRLHRLNISYSSGMQSFIESRP
jgi:hypothetical protein